MATILEYYNGIEVSLCINGGMSEKIYDHIRFNKGFILSDKNIELYKAKSEALLNKRYDDKKELSINKRNARKYMEFYNDLKRICSIRKDNTESVKADYATAEGMRINYNNGFMRNMFTGIVYGI